MAHDHDHDVERYRFEQLCTLALCGALGAVAVLLWYRDKLSFLHPAFRLPVLLGGIALLVLVAYRAIVLAWPASAKSGCKPHTDEHGPNSGPWRFAVLLFPVFLFFFNLPNEGFAYVPLGQLNTADIEWLKFIGDRGSLGHEITFKELQVVANRRDRRAAFEGKTVELKGQFVKSDNDCIFRLVRLKINCCAADAIPLNVIVIVEPKDPMTKEKLPQEKLQMKWVRVTGQLQFQARKQGGWEEWMTLLIVRPDEKNRLHDLVTEIPPNERPPAFEF